jgi:hypothetical protein
VCKKYQNACVELAQGDVDSPESSMRASRTALIVLLLLANAATAAAQFEPRPAAPPTGVPLLDDARRAQFEFEQFRRLNLPPYTGRTPSGANCDEQVGRFCYWYDERLPAPPPEPPSIANARAALLETLDRAAASFPDDDWTAGQRVRYLVEDLRPRDAVTAARACRGDAWWCDALVGFALHESRDFAAADAAFARALGAMSERLRCEWNDIGLLLDAGARMTYRRFGCGTPERERYSERLWWLAKPLYATPGMDTRTEWFARMTMVRMLEDAPSTHQFGFDADERELLLRYGWPRAWSRGGRDAEGMFSIIGHEPTPAYQFLPSAALANAPAMSDSTGWEDGVPPIQARYAPPHVARLHPLVHQSAMFRRGDSALVVLAWDATKATAVADGPREMALTLGRADSLSFSTTRIAAAPLKGVMTSQGRWGPLLMSAELIAPAATTAARARYGLRPPYAVGARVTLSEMLFFSHGAELPETLEQAIPRALASIRVSRRTPLGVYFESYGTSPTGEMLKVTMTVAREEEEPGFIRRRAQALRLSREATPVSVTVEDISARNRPFTPRAVYLDITSLRRGNYIVQLEVEVAGQYVVRSERSLEIID